MTNRGFAAPKGEVYGCIESGNGELGYYIVSSGDNVPWRARTRPCSYINYQVFPKMIEGHMISDVVAVSAASTSSPRNWIDRNRK
jgi:NADH-quinone oxidoreductase subunit D